jgi:hypothetical protein
MITARDPGKEDGMTPPALSERHTMDDIQLSPADEECEEVLQGLSASAPATRTPTISRPRAGASAPESPQGNRLLQLIQPLIDKRTEDQDMPVTVCRVPPDMDHEQCLDWVEMVLEDPEADAADIPAHLTVLGRMDPISLPL